MHILFNTHTHTHLLHCLGLSLTPCHWSRQQRFGLSGLYVGSLSLELTPWCHPRTPETFQSVYRCLQEINHILSVVIFYTFFIVNKSKTENDFVQVKTLICISKTWHILFLSVQCSSVFALKLLKHISEPRCWETCFLLCSCGHWFYLPHNHETVDILINGKSTVRWPVN